MPSALDPDLIWTFFMALLWLRDFFDLYDLYPGFIINRHFNDRKLVVRQFTWILRNISSNPFFRLSPNTSNK